MQNFIQLKSPHRRSPHRRSPHRGGADAVHSILKHFAPPHDTHGITPTRGGVRAKQVLHTPPSLVKCKDGASSGVKHDTAVSKTPILSVVESSISVCKPDRYNKQLQEIVDKSQNALIGDSDKRRGPSRLMARIGGQRCQPGVPACRGPVEAARTSVPSRAAGRGGARHGGGGGGGLGGSWAAEPIENRLGERHLRMQRRAAGYYLGKVWRAFMQHRAEQAYNQCRLQRRR